LIIDTYADALPLLVPIPSFDGHIIAPGQYDTQRRVHCEASNVVGVGLVGGNLFVSVVIEDAQLEVIRASNEPVFSRDEANASNGDCCDLKRLDSRACFVVVNDHRSVVESSNEPWFRRVEVDRLDAVGPLEQFSLLLGSLAPEFLQDCSAHIDVQQHIPLLPTKVQISSRRRKAT